MKQIIKLFQIIRERGIVTAIRRVYIFVRSKLGLASAYAISDVKPGDGQKTSPHTDFDQTQVPLPPLSLMKSVGSINVESFVLIGNVWSRLLLAEMKQASTILDIGSGCGRIARGLVGSEKVAKYVGFDVIKENVDWCQNYLVPLEAGKFHFHHFDVYSAEYNPSGTIRPNELAFPLRSDEADIVFAASVFTHLRERDARHYLKEINRVLEPRWGRAFLSIHCSPGLGKLYSGSEGRIDVDEDYFIKIASENGLALEKRFGDFYGQNLLCLKKK